MDHKATIRDYIKKMQANQGRKGLNDDTALIEEGFLDSLAAVELVLFLEERFGVEIDPGEVNQELFYSVNAIAALIEQKRLAQTVLEQA